MRRREFIIITGIGATSASLLSACGHPEEKIVPAFIPDDEYVPGIDYWKATACAMCDAGCGIIVRTREHKANKIEGNPLHPVNRGALCARGQAGLQVLYNPDRIRGPLRRAGERFSGEFEQISWDEAIKELTDRLYAIKAQGRANAVAFATTDVRDVTGLAAEHFISAYGNGILVNAESGSEAPAASDYLESYGRDVIPVFDLANTTYLLSFGARFLETWHSPVMYSLAYGEFRRGKARPRGKFIQIEPRMSLTGANADEWLPAAPGSEGLVALAIAQVILREGLVKNTPAPDFLINPLDDYAPEKTAGQMGLQAEKIIRIAREFVSSAAPLALSSISDPDSLKAIHFLNRLVGNLDKPGGVLLSMTDYFDPFAKLRQERHARWMSFSEDAFTGSDIKALLIHRANPAHRAPWMVEKIKAIPFIASFSTFMDETAQLSDLVLPDHSYLESWDLKSAYLSGEAVVTLMQPVLNPQFDTRQTADVLIALGKEHGDGVASTLNFETAEGIVKQIAGELPESGGQAMVEEEGSEDPLDRFTERGAWTGKPAGSRDAQAFASGPPLMAPQSNSAASDGEYPLTLLAYEHPALGFGEGANLPWLQELPDTLTSVMWGSWVEINPKTAASLGISDGDTVEVQTAHGQVRAPAVVYPAIRPDVIAMPCGQGHTAYGRYAQSRGVNPLILAPRGAARARVSKAPGEAKLVRFGTLLPERPEARR